MKYIAPVLMLIGLMACEQAPKADKAKVTDARTVKEAEGSAYRVDTVQSVLQWIGTKPTGKHIGRFRLQSGNLFVKDTLITAGTVNINMGSLQDLDLVQGGDTSLLHKLETELKGPLFFDVQAYPVATFEITGVTTFKPSVGNEVLMKNANYNVQGNLTIKNITKNISFPACITRENGVITAEANFNIDRTLWGMTYRADKSVQDKLINAMVNIQFKVIAKK
jgi:polyisoprenoid-binding protein YceI